MDHETLKNSFQTPAFVGRYMVSLIPPGVKTILEPTPGKGQIVELLTDDIRNFKVTAPDDYFLLDKSKKFDCVIMNPPFSSKYANFKNAAEQYQKGGMSVGYQILHDCLELSDSIIALMPWFVMLDSDVRMRHLKKFGIKSLTTLPRKTFDYARIQTVVIELKKNWKKPTVFKVYDLLK